MKKIVILIIPLLILLGGCTNEVEENKYAYLEYKNNLEHQEEFTEETDFNTYFNIKRTSEEITEYSIEINNPKVDMYNVKALLIHDYVQDEVYPSVGILEKPVTLLKDNNDKIILKGIIQTIDNIKDVKFKLYLEYTDEEGNQNKIYYQVSRG